MKNKRLQIGIDIDGVLMDTDYRAFLNFCEQELGWNIDYQAFEQTHSWFKATGQDTKEVLGEAFRKFLEKTEEAQQPIEGAHDALKKLGAVADIVLITARPRSLRQVTQDFLNTHLRDVRYREILMGDMDNKAQSIINFEIDYYVDDSYQEISMILQNKSVSAKIIPFPAFHGMPNWHDMKDERIHWLSVWQDIKHDVPLEQQADIRRKAWEEIVQLVHQPAQ